jgi:hypothetical protein
MLQVRWPPSGCRQMAGARQGHRVPVGALDEVGLLAALVEPTPLDVSAGDHEAATRLGGLPVGGLGGDRLGACVDPCRPTGVLRPPWRKAPAQHIELTFVVRLEDGVYRIGMRHDGSVNVSWIEAST